MVQLNISSGGSAPEVRVIKRFPCGIGRAPSADIRLEQAGCWDRHLELDVLPSEGCSVTLLPGALATVNGFSIERVLLRNGDVIEFGTTRIEFSLSPTRQRGFRLRETVTWLALVAVVALQVALIWRILP
ncbi:MAG: FHA domain-containing protein [Verrucomicrobiota bacterium]